MPDKGWRSMTIEAAARVGDRHKEGRALSLLGRVLPKAQRNEAIAAFEVAIAVFKETEETDLERAAMSGLLSLRFSRPILGRVARPDRRGVDRRGMPGLWMDVTVLVGQDEQEGQHIAEEIRTRIRKATAETADRAAR
jgi:hypothetical protein